MQYRPARRHRRLAEGNRSTPEGILRAHWRSGCAKSRLIFGVTFLLTAPIWALSAASGMMILPGLPIAAFSVVCPTLAAWLIVAVKGPAGSSALLRRAFDASPTRSGRWWFPIVLISSAIAAASFAILRVSGSAIPNPHFAMASSLALLALFLVGGLAEEIGWSGFALDPLQARWGPLAAGLVLGAVWVLWHYPALSRRIVRGDGSRGGRWRRSPCGW